MKNTFTSLLLIMISNGFSLQSCEKKAENIAQTQHQKAIKENTNSIFKSNEYPESNRNEDIILGEDISKINAYAKKIYKVNDVIYIDIDVVEFRYPTKGEWDESDREIVNKNPKIRTYIIDNKTSILSNNCKDLTSSELFQLQESILNDKSIIVIGISKNGKMQEINFGCYG